MWTSTDNAAEVQAAVRSQTGKRHGRKRHIVKDSSDFEEVDCHINMARIVWSVTGLYLSRLRAEAYQARQVSMLGRCVSS